MENNLNSLRKRLSNYRKIVAEKREFEIRLEELKDDIGLKGVTYGKEGTSYNISKSTEEQATRIVNAQEQLDKLIRNKGHEIARIDNAMSVLSEREKKVIELKYIKDYSWETVAVGLDRSISHCKQIEKKALDRMKAILNINV